MPGKNIKDSVVHNFISLQDKGPLAMGFPMFCFLIAEDEDASFFTEHLFHEQDNVKVLPVITEWEQIAVESELFSSRGDARRNSFKGFIKQGWHQITSGKGMHQKFIFLFKV